MRWSGLRNSVGCAGGGAVAGRRFQTCRPGCRANEQNVEAEVTGDAGRWANWRSKSSSDVDRDAAMLDEACGCCAGRVWRDLEARSLTCQAALRCHGGCARRLHSAACCANPFSRIHAVLQVWSEKRGARRDTASAIWLRLGLSKPYQRQAGCVQITHPCTRAGSLAGSAQKRWRGRRQGKPVAAPLYAYCAR